MHENEIIYLKLGLKDKETTLNMMHLLPLDYKPRSDKHEDLRMGCIGKYDCLL